VSFLLASPFSLFYPRRFPTSLRAAIDVALTGRLLLTVSCKKTTEVTPTSDVLSSQDVGLNDDENAAPAALVEATAPQDATASASSTVVDTPELTQQQLPCATRTYEDALTPSTCVDD
jgi:hypothetical protein